EEAEKRLSSDSNIRRYDFLYNQYHLQYRWICDVSQQISEFPTTTTTSSSSSCKVEFSPPANIQNDDLLLQGPFVLQPSPLELSPHPFDASDIMYLNTQPIDVIVTASSNGRLDI